MWNLRNVYRLIFFLGVSLYLSFTYAQDDSMHIRGVVVDSNGVDPIKNAVITAVRLSDSLLLKFQRSDSNGVFDFFLPIDTFTLIVSHPKYDPRTFYIIGSDENKNIDIPKLKLYEKYTQIDELVIYAYKDPVHYRGDTLVYVADSFLVKPNAVVEDLLKKLPGMEVDQNGKIKVQGREIQKVLVDGDEFFGKDPTIATKNLGADAIETVEVYEKIDEDNFGSDEKIQVLDLKLKENAKKGYFGKATIASDAGAERKNDPFYEGEFMYNRFVSSQKLSLFAVGTNTPKQGVSEADADKFGLDNESGYGFNDEDGSDQHGIPKTLKTGIYYTDKIGKKKQTKILGNYSYYDTKMDVFSNNQTYYMLTDTTYSSKDSTSNRQGSQKHTINLNIDSELDSLTRLLISQRFAFEQKEVQSYMLTDYINSNNQDFLKTLSDRSTPSNSANIKSRLWLSKRFQKDKRKFELDYSFKHTEGKTDGLLKTLSNFLSTPSLNDTVDQSKYNARKNSSHSITGTYTEPLNSRWKIAAIYQYTNEMGRQDRTTNDYDPLTNRYNNYRTDLSNDFRSTRNDHKAGLSLIMDTTKHYLSFRLDVGNVIMDNFNLVNQQHIDQNIMRLLPSMRYTLRPNMSQYYQVMYKTSYQLPSINDLQPVPDNSNPNRIQEGNLDLVPTYIHNINAWGNTWNALSGSYTWFGTDINLKNNDFSQATNYNAFGQMTSKTINVNGSFSGGVYGGLGIPLQGTIIQIRPHTYLGYRKTTSIINNNNNITQHLSASIRADIKFNWDSLEMSFGGQYYYVQPKNSLSSINNTPFGTQTYTGALTWQMPVGFQIKTDFRYLITNQLSRGYNVNIFVWNAELSKSFFKTENLIVSIVATDLLNQNMNTQRNVDANIITDNRTLLISRYFLAKITLKFNNNKTKEDESKEMWD